MARRVLNALCDHLLSLIGRSTSSGTIYPIKWSSKTYGLDGPWYAVSLAVGGYDDYRETQLYQTKVDLLPGGLWVSTIISNAACNSSTTTPDCGAGGTWNPKTAFTGMQKNQTIDGKLIGMTLTDNNFAGDMRYLSSTVYAQRINLNYEGSNIYPKFSVPNSTMAVTENATIIWPNGHGTSLNIGNLALGADTPRMNFTWTNNPDDNIPTYNLPGYLSMSGMASNSYTIQIGSVALKYPPSLIFGGYDQGRGIGNVVSWSSSALMLRDVVLGVETGGSPWDFESKTGLLVDNERNHTSIPVYVDPIAPYLHLPETTCSNIAQHLPVYFDTVSKYYLWDTNNPAYTKVVTSAAYPGFVFAPSFGSLDPVTIKVPLIYLNLTLQPGASGLASTVAYFPCQNYWPDTRPLATAGSLGGTYTLGRAFLQAAVLGRNWDKGISWLAQAPGPGPDRSGLGYKPLALSNDDTTLSFQTDSSLFNATMRGYWQPLPGSAISSIPQSSTAPNTGSPASSVPDSLLKPGAIIGIGVGAGVAVLVLLLIGFCVWYRRGKSSPSTVVDGHDNAAAPPYERYAGDRLVPELYSVRPDSYYKYFYRPQELSGTRDPRELDSRTARMTRYEMYAGPGTPAMF